MENPIGDIFSYRDLKDYESFLEEQLISDWNSHQEKHFGNNCEANDWYSEAAVFAIQYGKGDSKTDFNLIFEDEIKHFKEVEDFVKEVGDYGDTTIILDTHFETHLKKELLGDRYIDSVESRGVVIDWGTTIDSWLEGYSEVEYNGKTYQVCDV